MNYFALAGAIILWLIALRSLAVIIRVSTDHRVTWEGPYGFWLNALIASGAGTATVWLISVAL